MVEKRELIIIAEVSNVLDFRKKNSCGLEKCIEHTVGRIKKYRSDSLKKEILSAVNFALKILEKEPKLSNAKVIERVVKNINSFRVED